MNHTLHLSFLFIYLFPAQAFLELFVVIFEIDGYFSSSFPDISSDRQKNKIRHAISSLKSIVNHFYVYSHTSATYN